MVASVIIFKNNATNNLIYKKKGVRMAGRKTKYAVSLLVNKIWNGIFQLTNYIDYKTMMVVENETQKMFIVRYDDFLIKCRDPRYRGKRRSLKEIEEAVILPLEKPELFKEIGIKPSKGLILYSKPGLGKTKIARCIANRANSIFISLCATELI